jgi:uncharacterized membrane protein
MYYSGKGGMEVSQIFIIISGYTAVFLVLSNFLMFILFLWIRKSKNRAVQKKVARTARFWMKTHRPFAVAAVFIVIIHFISVFQYLNFRENIQAATGLLAAAIFIILFVSGLIRNRKATGRRRKFHRFMAFLFLIMMFLHLFSSWFTT